jgi:hypothetical protein
MKGEVGPPGEVTLMQDNETQPDTGGAGGQRVMRVLRGPDGEDGMNGTEGEKGEKGDRGPQVNPIRLLLLEFLSMTCRLTEIEAHNHTII